MFLGETGRDLVLALKQTALHHSALPLPSIKEVVRHFRLDRFGVFKRGHFTRHNAIFAA